MCRCLKFVCKMVLIWFLCLFTWYNHLSCLNLCCFGKTKVEMLKFVALIARCLTNNFWKFYQKILNYSENNEIFVGGVFFWPHPVYGTPCMLPHSMEVVSWPQIIATSLHLMCVCYTSHCADASELLQTRTVVKRNGRCLCYWFSD